MIIFLRKTVIYHLLSAFAIVIRAHKGSVISSKIERIAIGFGIGGDGSNPA